MRQGPFGLLCTLTIHNKLIRKSDYGLFRWQWQWFPIRRNVRHKYAQQSRTATNDYFHYRFICLLFFSKLLVWLIKMSENSKIYLQIACFYPTKSPKQGHIKCLMIQNREKQLIFNVKMWLLQWIKGQIVIIKTVVNKPTSRFSTTGNPCCGIKMKQILLMK